MALNINRVVLGGNIVADPVYTDISQYTKVCEFTIANNKMFFDREGVRQVRSNYVDVVTWNKVADIARNLEKSESVICEGELSENRWTSNEGEPRKKLRLKAYKIYRESIKSRKEDEMMIIDHMDQVERSRRKDNQTAVPKEDIDELSQSMGI